MDLRVLPPMCCRPPCLSLRSPTVAALEMLVWRALNLALAAPSRRPQGALVGFSNKALLASLTTQILLVSLSNRVAQPTKKGAEAPFLHSRSLSDLGIVGCESASAVHFLPDFCPIVELWACKSGKNCPRWGRFSLSTPQARQAPRR